MTNHVQGGATNAGAAANGNAAANSAGREANTAANVVNSVASKATSNTATTTKSYDGAFGAVRRWIDEHPNLWEFILFNILSNISTITRFVVTWIGTAVFVSALSMHEPFQFLFFDYSSSSSNGLGGFLTFLLAEVLAQIVNFFVQMKWVFKSNSDFSQAAWKYAILAVIVVVVNLILPGHVTSLCKGWGLGDQVASTIASLVNTVLAVIVSYPLLKFWIMPKKA